MTASVPTEAMTPIPLLEALLRASKAIASTRDRHHGVEMFARELHSVVDFDYLFISNCAGDADEAKWMLELNGRRLERAEIGIPLQECTGRWVYEKQQVLSIADWT